MFRKWVLHMYFREQDETQIWFGKMNKLKILTLITRSSTIHDIPKVLSAILAFGIFVITWNKNYSLQNPGILIIIIYIKSNFEYSKLLNLNTLLIALAPHCISKMLNSTAASFNFDVNTPKPITY